MSAPSEHPWIRLRDADTAQRFSGKRIEARRTTTPSEYAAADLRATWHDIKTYTAGRIFRDGLGHWLLVLPLDGGWTDGLLLGEIWEVREAQS